MLLLYVDVSVMCNSVVCLLFCLLAVATNCDVEQGEITLSSTIFNEEKVLDALAEGYGHDSMQLVLVVFSDSYCSELFVLIQETFTPLQQETELSVSV